MYSVFKNDTCVAYGEKKLCKLYAKAIKGKFVNDYNAELNIDRALELELFNDYPLRKFEVNLLKDEIQDIKDSHSLMMTSLNNLAMINKKKITSIIDVYQLYKEIDLNDINQLIEVYGIGETILSMYKDPVGYAIQCVDLYININDIEF